MLRGSRLGRYDLLSHLASGGMGRVYLARLAGVGGFSRHVVLKTVHPEEGEDPAHLNMFLDEARLVATLHHQHVAQVFECGVADDGTYFLAMEYLHGETVRAVLDRSLERRYVLPLDFALTIVEAAAGGLHHAHEQRSENGRPLGIVHRDVTPANLIAGYDGSVKLLDFGIAKAVMRATRTKTGVVKGKPGYMAPEQVLSHPIDRRCDVFALGIVLYELTTQVTPFGAPNDYETAHRIVTGDVVPPSARVPGYPAELEAIVMTALETEPAMRFRDAEVMRRAIERVAHRLDLTLGVSAVRRVLDDLFGRKPEPWVRFGKGSESMPSLTGVDGTTGPVDEFNEDSTTLEFASIEADAPPTPVPVPISIERILDALPDAPSAPEPSLAPLAEPPVRAPLPRAPLIVLAAASVILLVGLIALAVRGTDRITVATEPPPFASPVAAPTPPPAPAPTLRPPRKPPAKKPAATVTKPAAAKPAATLTPPAPTPKPAPAPTPAPPAETMWSPPPPPPVPPVEMPLPRRRTGTATVRVTTNPSNATVVLNGHRLGRTPLVATFRVDPDRKVVLKVRKHGYRSRRQQVTLDGDLVWYGVPLVARD